jgi:hypothetical protein
VNYVAAGYGAVAAILVVYVAHIRHRARVLTRTLPPRATDNGDGS